MKQTMGYNIAVVGATGNSGMETIKILEERDFPVSNITAIASERSIGREISFKDSTIKIKNFSDVDFSKIHIAFFCAGGGFSRRNAEFVANNGCIVIDKSSFFRLNPHVPLIIPEVNMKTLHKGAPLGIVSSPNCIATPLALALKAISKEFPIKRAVVSTYQSVSGAGRKAIDELYKQTKGIISAAAPVVEVFTKQIAYNVIPAIGDISASGSTDEEEKISQEICKILKSDVKIAVTCVRVPVFIGHCMSVACEFSEPISEKQAYEVFENFDGIVVIDRREGYGVFATPVDVAGEDAIYISRIRKDVTVKNGLIFWIASDNLRKGAALNSVQIAEEMIKEDPQLSIFKKRL